jgi:hypothetical protein
MISFKCGHSECGDQHTLLVEVLPVAELAAFEGRPCLSHRYGAMNAAGEAVADAGAAFGASPKITCWEMCHGAGGGIFDVPFWVHDADELWAKAGAMIGLPRADPLAIA